MLVYLLIVLVTDPALADGTVSHFMEL